MSISDLNYGFSFYFGLLAFATLWICGLFAVTRKGKLLYFVLRYFERVRTERRNCSVGVNKIFDMEMAVGLPLREGNINSPLDSLQQYVKGYMDEHKIFSDVTTNDLLINLIARHTARVAQKSTEHAVNEYYHLEDVSIIPAYIRDPVICCITCMGSLHTLIVYTASSLLFHYPWNPFEWVALAVPAAFTGEFLWFLKKKIQS